MPNAPLPRQPEQIASGQQAANNAVLNRVPGIMPKSAKFAGRVSDRRCLAEQPVKSQNWTKSALPRRPMMPQWRPQPMNMRPAMWQNAGRQQQMANRWGGNRAMMASQGQFAGMQAAGQSMGGPNHFFVPAIGSRRCSAPLPVGSGGAAPPWSHSSPRQSRMALSGLTGCAR